MKDKLELSFRDFNLWFDHPVTQALILALKESETNKVHGLGRLDLKRSTDEVAMHMAQISGELKVYRLLQDRDLLKEELREVVDWEEESVRDDTSNNVQYTFENGRPRGFPKK